MRSSICVASSRSRPAPVPRRGSSVVLTPAPTLARRSAASTSARTSAASGTRAPVGRVSAISPKLCPRLPRIGTSKVGWAPSASATKRSAGGTACAIAVRASSREAAGGEAWVRARRPRRRGRSRTAARPRSRSSRRPRHAAPPDAPAARACCSAELRGAANMPSFSISTSALGISVTLTPSLMHHDAVGEADHLLEIRRHQTQATPSAAARRISA